MAPNEFEFFGNTSRVYGRSPGGGILRMSTSRLRVTHRARRQAKQFATVRGTSLPGQTAEPAHELGPVIGSTVERPREEADDVETATWKASRPSQADTPTPTRRRPNFFRLTCEQPLEVRAGLLLASPPHLGFPAESAPRAVPAKTMHSLWISVWMRVCKRHREGAGERRDDPGRRPRFGLG
jgi:hypothetical protein